MVVIVMTMEQSHHQRQDDGDKNSNMSAQLTPTRSDRNTTTTLNIQYFLAESTSDFDEVDQMTTDTDLWSSVSSSEQGQSSTGSLTSEYSGVILPSYWDLLFYSPSKPQLPQPDDDLLVPVQEMLDNKLRVIP